MEQHVNVEDKSLNILPSIQNCEYNFFFVLHFQTEKEKQVTDFNMCEMSPIDKEAGQLTASEMGSPNGESDDGALEIINEEGEEESEHSQSQSILNTKHYSYNDRLRDPKTVKVSAKRSLRLTPGKKNNNPDLIKTASKATGSALVKGKKVVSSSKTSTGTRSSTKNPSSCKETAEVPETTSKPKTLKKDEPKGSGQKVLGTATFIVPSGNEDETAEVRYTRLYGKSVDGQVIPDKPAPKKDVPTKANPKSSSKGKGKKASTVKDKQVPSTSKDVTLVSDSESSYTVTVNPDWYAQQGSEYRKLKDIEAARKKKEKADNDPLVQIMREKADNIKKMTDCINANPGGQLTTPIAVSPEQLWADSMVPHLGRMRQEIRDEFMVHVLGLAFQAISGKWKP